MKALALAPVLALAAVTLAAPSPAEPAQRPGKSAAAAPVQAPVFGTGTELVQVDVVVLDRLGNPVEGLKEDEFVLKEDGRIQTVQEFEAVALPESAPSRTAATTFVSTNIRPRERRAAALVRHRLRRRAAVEDRPASARARP